jgi:hypothetical protein
MAQNGKVLLVGSVGLEDADQVFRALGERLGSRAKRYPDGETGPRYYWIRWVAELFQGHPQLAVHGGNQGVGEFQGQAEIPSFTLADGVGGQDLNFATLGYAQAALESHAKFQALKESGVIPPGTRFQVSLPTAIALSTTFMHLDRRGEIEPAIEAGLIRDAGAIAAGIPAGELAIQWDVCHEVVAHDGAEGRWVLHYENILDGSVERIARLLAAIPDGAEAGIHLCYGDPGHAHIIEPKDFATCVAFANRISAAAPREIQWMHMPVPRGRADDAYFAPLQDLKLAPETELYLGLVHHTDGAVGTRARIAAAGKYADNFGIATECGFGRRPAKTIPELLRIHAEVADGA